MGTHMWGCWSICRADVDRGFLTLVELPAHSSVSVLGRRLTLMCFSTFGAKAYCVHVSTLEFPWLLLLALLPKWDQSQALGAFRVPEESQKSYFCIRSSWDLDLFLLLYSKLGSIQKLFSIPWCWRYWKRLPSIISCLTHLAPLHMFGNLPFNLQLQRGLFSEKMQISLQRVFLSENLFKRVWGTAYITVLYRVKHRYLFWMHPHNCQLEKNWKSDLNASHPEIFWDMAEGQFLYLRILQRRRDCDVFVMM